MDWVIIVVVLVSLGLTYHRLEKKVGKRYEDATRLVRDHARALADHGDNLKLKEKRS